VAYLSFRFFETPLLRIKRRFETSDQQAGDELSRR
jgi:peptidoglycan/LPS O-acetylase OafA/YrhL